MRSLGREFVDYKRVDILAGSNCNYGVRDLMAGKRRSISARGEHGSSYSILAPVTADYLPTFLRFIFKSLSIFSADLSQLSLFNMYLRPLLPSSVLFRTSPIFFARSSFVSSK